MSAGMAGRVGAAGGRGQEALRPAHVAAVLPQDSLRHHQQERLGRGQQAGAQALLHRSVLG